MVAAHPALSQVHTTKWRRRFPSKRLNFIEMVNELRWQLQLNVDTHPSIMAAVDAACEELMIQCEGPLHLRASACYDRIHGVSRASSSDARAQTVDALPDGVLVNSALYLQNRFDEAFKFVEAGWKSPRVLHDDGASDTTALSKLITHSRPPSARSRPSSARLPAASIVRL